MARTVQIIGLPIMGDCQTITLQKKIYTHWGEKQANQSHQKLQGKWCFAEYMLMMTDISHPLLGEYGTRQISITMKEDAISIEYYFPMMV